MKKIDAIVRTSQRGSEALNRDVPLLGICRGAQFINAALGGSLYQDIPSQMPAAVSHCMKSPYDRYWHKVSPMPDTPLSAMPKATALQVNSYHHQGIRDLSFQLCPMAYSPDGLVEAFYHSSKKVHVGSAVASRVPVAERPCAANDIPGVRRCLRRFPCQRGGDPWCKSEKERFSISFRSLVISCVRAAWLYPWRR